MSSSYEKINYSLRPAKSSERKMLGEAIRRLSVFAKIESYSYIGFGSTYFSDFLLFHKLLGISDMISIEKDVNNSERFNFNKPYGCVKMEYGESEQVLTELNWTGKKVIVWLDYDDPLKSSMLIDLDTFMANAEPGSMFIISFNAQNTMATGTVEEIKQTRLKNLEERIGSSKVPIGLDGSELGLGGIPKIYYKIILDEIEEIISQRNIGLRNDDKLIFKQLFNFLYQDGAQMQTIGGMLLAQNQLSQFDNAHFDDLSFIRSDDKVFKIEVPILTFKEIQFLDANIHTECNLTTGEINRRSDLLRIGIPERDIKKYMKIYRYFPTFAEALF